MVRNAVYSFVNPEDQSKNGLLLSWNKDFAATIGIEAGKTDPSAWSERERQDLIKFLTGGGKSLPRSDESSVESGSGPRLAQPWAHCYGGHQFGYYAGQLGDGRAISLCKDSGSGLVVLPVVNLYWHMSLTNSNCL